MLIKIDIFGKGVHHQLKNYDFLGRLVEKISISDKSQYEFRNLRKKLYKKTYFIKISKSSIKVCQAGQKPIF